MLLVASAVALLTTLHIRYNAQRNEACRRSSIADNLKGRRKTDAVYEKQNKGRLVHFGDLWLRELTVF